MLTAGFGKAARFTEASWDLFTTVMKVTPTKSTKRLFVVYKFDMHVTWRFINSDAWKTVASGTADQFIYNFTYNARVHFKTTTTLDIDVTISYITVK